MRLVALRPLAPGALALLMGAGAARSSTSRSASLTRGAIGGAPAAHGVAVAHADELPDVRAPLDAVPAAERGDTSRGLSGALRVHLLTPGSAPAGVYPVPGGVGGEPFAFVGVVPFGAKRGASIATYHVGYWPAELHRVRSAAYDNPDGFVEVTAANADLPVSRHFRLGDLATHDAAPFPKYIVLREALLDKLELVLSDLEAHGVPTSHVRILSGFRTPAYNLALGDASGRARESRHQYGDAADVIIDADQDGRMDDLNGDGRVDGADVQVIEAAVDRVERAYPELAGGLGMYEAMGPSGPFAHLDVRGSRARWGTAPRRDRFATASGAASGDDAYASAARRGASASGGVSHCFAEGASAVLCQGFRHTR